MVGDLPAEPVKIAVTAEIEARSEEMPQILISANIPTPVAEVVTGSELAKTEVTAEEKTEKPVPTPTATSTFQPVSKSAPVSTKPKPGDRKIIDGEPHVWIPGLGWILDEGGGSIGIMVGNPDDQLTGNNVGVMGGGTNVDGKRLYEDNVLGKVTNEQFRMLSGDYNAEQKSLKERIPKTAERIEELQASISNVTRFIDKARRYTEITEFNAELLNIFIEKIEVGERAERYSRTAEQEIVIHYRDIGVVSAFADEAEKVAEIRQRQTA